ncbi:MAG: hypothetical protein AB2A00_10755 [Myxococcota bacterium]
MNTTFISRSRKTISSLFTGAALALSLQACNPMQEEEESKDPATACSDLCTQEGFSSSSVDVQSNETNCFCSGGSGTMTDAHCADMCSSIGKGNAQTFNSTAGGAKDSCQCS